MEHQETIRILPDAKTAVLFIHGICSTPDIFRTMLPLEKMVPDDYSLYNLRLPGHGGTTKDFAQSSMRQWRSYTRECFLKLAQSHEKLILVGHSMGTLLSVELSLEFPEKVAALFLVAVPLRVGLKPITVINLMRMSFGHLDPEDRVLSAMYKMCGVQTTRLVWKYATWIPRLWELVRLMHRTAEILDGITVPCVAFQSQQDEMVSLRSSPIIRKCGRIELYHLSNSTHFYYAPEDQALVEKRFGEIL